MIREEPTPNPRARPAKGDDPLGVWVALCPVYGWDHAAVYNDPAGDVNCPRCWSFWGYQRPCEIRHYDTTDVSTEGAMRDVSEGEGVGDDCSA